MTHHHYIAWLMALMLTACTTRSHLRPSSGGRPYEVVVVGDADSTLYRLLTADVAGLPWHEPMFDVTCISSRHFGSTMHLARNIILVDVNDKTQQHTTVSYERNVWAEPQMMVYVKAPSASQLIHDAPRLQSVTRLLSNHETSIATNNLMSKYNLKMQAEVKRMFGIDINVPTDMKKCKHGKNFIWLSNDSPTAMTNICIYTSTNRDSVMKVNIKGETDQMYMTTANNTPPINYSIKHNGRTINIQRGMWEMYGDAMGGPYIQHTLHNIGGHHTLVAEVFVYAPGTKKRNLLLNTEAALLTIR